MIETSKMYKQLIELTMERSHHTIIQTHSWKRVLKQFDLLAKRMDNIY